MFAWRTRNAIERRTVARLAQLLAEAAEAGAWAGQGVNGDGFLESIAPTLRALAVPTVLSADVDPDVLAAQAVTLEGERSALMDRPPAVHAPLPWWAAARRFERLVSDLIARRQVRAHVRRLSKEINLLRRDIRRVTRARSRIDGWIAVHEPVVRAEYARQRARAILAGRQPANDGPGVRESGPSGPSGSPIGLDDLSVASSDSRSVQ